MTDAPVTLTREHPFDRLVGLLVEPLYRLIRAKLEADPNCARILEEYDREMGARDRD